MITWPARLRAWLPRGTIRLRLTLIYSGVILLAGAALLTITYLLMRHTGGIGVFIRPPASGAEAQLGDQVDLSELPPAKQALARQLQASADHQRSSDLEQLLVQSGIALAITAVFALVLGWFVAGRALRPLRTITATTQQITQHNLHERLGLRGPADEVKDLADTIDGLLDRIETAFDAQRRFVANASHELRTPLTWERAIIDVALANPHASAATLRAGYGELLDSTQEQERLIDALLTLASSERGLDQHDAFDLALVAEDVVLQYEPTARAVGLTINARFDRAPAVGNPDLVKRLVANLVSNAVRHNTASGRVDVSTQTCQGRATLTVVNTGPVVPSSDLDRLMEPFQRLATPRTDRSGGNGLGLSIVHAIATAHDTDLDIRPRPGGGLLVEVTFPAATPDTEARSSDTSRHGAP